MMYIQWSSTYENRISGDGRTPHQDQTQGALIGIRSWISIDEKRNPLGLAFLFLSRTRNGGPTGKRSFFGLRKGRL